MTVDQLAIATNTVWVVVAAILVMFMQAGFALLEAGLTRQKNAAHIAGKNIIIFAVCSLVYWAVGFGLAFGNGNGFIGTSGFFPGVNELTSVGKAPFEFISTVPVAAGYLFQVVFAGVSLAIVWGSMAERAKLWVYLAFGVIFTIIYSTASHWIWGGGWLFDKGMQDFAGSTVVHYQGALAGLAGALILGPRIGRFGTDGRAHAIPGHSVPFAVLGTFILWFGWFGFNPGSTLGVITNGNIGFFGYVALTTNLAAAAGGLSAGAVAWWMHKKPDIGNILNGVLAALVAITAASGFVDAWAAVVVGAVAGVIAVVGVVFVERIRIDDPVGAVAVHGLAGVWGTLACGLFAAPELVKITATGTEGLVYSGSFHQLGIQLLGLAAVGAFTFSTSFAVLWTMNKIWGIRVEDEVEEGGLDLHEHGHEAYPQHVLPEGPLARPGTNGNGNGYHAPETVPTPA
jgi:Amt family ammonium transporter